MLEPSTESLHERFENNVKINTNGNINVFILITWRERIYFCWMGKNKKLTDVKDLLSRIVFLFRFFDFFELDQPVNLFSLNMISLSYLLFPVSAVW